MNDFDKKLDFDSNTFENMKHDMNFVLQRLLGNMIENGKSVQHQSDGKRNTEVQPADTADNSNNDIHTSETRCGRSSWWRPSAVMVGRGRLGRVCYPDKSKPKDKST
ncbi:MAG: hypothetical protein ACLU0A_05555 [Roseburia sp.]